MLVTSPFFGINRTQAVRKVFVRTPFLKQQIAYLNKGVLRRFQNFDIKAILRPSTPGADLRFASFTALSNSDMSKGFSKESLSEFESLLSFTILCSQISGPKNFSIHPLKSFLVLVFL